MSQQKGGFGRRGQQLPAQNASPPITSGGETSPLVKQIGGIALGVALAVAIAAAHSYAMKQVGRSLDHAFVERAAPGNPAAAIGQVGGGDALLQSVHRVCTDRAARANLTERQKIAAEEAMRLYSGETELVRAAAYVACLTTERPQRFCQKPQQQHLFEAMRQYLKLAVQVQEEWKLQASRPSAMVAPAWTIKQLAALEMPSALLDPRIQDGLAALAANGYISASDLAGFTGLLASGPMLQAPRVGGQTSVQTGKGACK